jgi:hypothetical protein
MCRTAGETHPGVRPDDPTGPTHSGYRQYGLRAVLIWSILGFVLGTAFNLGIGFALYEKAYDDAATGVWERLDPATDKCKFSEGTQVSAEFTKGMPAQATKITYGLVCDTEFATKENGYVACQIDTLKDYGCPGSAVQRYSYFVNSSISGILNQQISLVDNPIICCTDRCPNWTQLWYCAPEHYDDGAICDCECGYPDPDCAPEMVVSGFRGCCHEDYVAFGTDHLIGCLNGTSPGYEYQLKCFDDLRCDIIYTPPADLLPFPCTFDATRNPATMPLEVAGLSVAVMWLASSPLMGLFWYLLCLAAYPAFALCCGLNWRPKRKVTNEPTDPPPRILNLKIDK